MNSTLYPAMAKSVSCLGRREEVLRWMWAGKGTKEIAAELGISPRTVDYHRAKLYQLFGVQDPVSLCRRAVEAGLIKWESGRTVSRGGKARTAQGGVGTHGT